MYIGTHICIRTRILDIMLFVLFIIVLLFIGSHIWNEN